MILGLLTNGCSQSENQFDDREQDWLVRNLGTSKAWRDSGRAISSSPHSRRKKEVLLNILRRILDDRVGYLVEWGWRVGVFLRKLNLLTSCRRRRRSCARYCKIKIINIVFTLICSLFKNSIYGGWVDVFTTELHRIRFTTCSWIVV